MNHRPFEDWLLNDLPITSEQRRDLDAHVRTCAYCSALVETGMVLGSVKKASPSEGFSARFRTRLAAHRLADRRRKFWGALLFTIGGLALLLWIVLPHLAALFSSPATWITSLVEWGIFLMTTLEALAEAGSVIVRVVPGFLPPFAWMILFSAIAGVSLLWSVSIWRFVRVPQGVQL